MASRSVIKVQWLQRDPEPNPVDVMITQDECLVLAQRAEAANQHDWAEYWMNEALKLEVSV